ncbi:diphosphomevalonate decarboxylase [Haloglomus irregulare]|uniref:Diphosphomevalonate decarboxylase n=1 Tax=Haloglomus irregulare TaxID=2234134 RepID=A0A554N7B2_9EURY|nr:phosphomevalonate decarboxylase MvaD [Haloglomus irregulare]TSD13295.1 diphosphomevalonate decarboxylase [Haloglomus irregulare]
MKATAVAHPIQGLVKYHGMSDHDLRLPYHDSISVCTAPSRTRTTVAFEERDADRYVVDGETVEGQGADRIRSVVERVRELSDEDRRVRMESESNFPTNIGFGSSASGFAALAWAACEAAGLDLDHPTVSAIARRGSASAARAVTGAFSDLSAGLNDEDCRSHRLETDLEDDLRVVACEVPAFKHTQAAHDEAEDSHMFEARMAHVHEQLQSMRDSLRRADFADTFGLAEHDSLSLAATTMTGPTGWVYWQPETLEIFETVHELRAEGLDAYYSTDTGASVYVNTTPEDVDRVQAAIEDLGVPTRVWEVGGPARIVDNELF